MYFNAFIGIQDMIFLHIFLTQDPCPDIASAWSRHVWGTNPYLKSEKPDGNVAASVSFMTIGVTLSSPQSSDISQTSPFSLVVMS